MNRAIALIVNSKRKLTGNYAIVILFAAILVAVLIDWISNSFTVITGLGIIFSATFIPVALKGIKDIKHYNGRIDRIITELQNDSKKGYASLNILCNSMRHELAKSIGRLGFNPIVPESKAMAAHNVKRNQQNLSYLETARDILTEEMKNKSY